MVSDLSDSDDRSLLLLLDALCDDDDIGNSRDCDANSNGVATNALRLGHNTSASAIPAAAAPVPDDSMHDDDSMRDDDSMSDDDSELVPLLELVSSEDAAHAHAPTIDADNMLEMHVTTQHKLANGYPLGPPSHIPHNSYISSGSVNALALPSTSTLVTNTNTSTQRSGKLVRKRPSANKARDERKSELIYLRNKVSELEARLSSVLANRPRIAAASSVTAVSTTSSYTVETGTTSGLRPLRPRPEGAPTGVWRDVAAHQREERAQAERENVRLKLVLENQLKVAKSLAKILNKKATTKDMQAFADRNSSSVRAPAAAALSDAAEFDALLQYVESMTLDLDTVFRENGLAHCETPMSSAEMRASVERGMFLEICANKILPFSIRATGDAVWHHFAIAKEHTPFRCYSTTSKLRSTEDTIMESFILKLDAKGTDANFRVKQVLRRHIEVDRVVIVWRAAFEAFEYSDEPVSGMRYNENGYIVIKKPRALAGDFSLLQTCYITTPNFPQDLSVITNPRVGAIADFVLAATAANVSSTHQMIENVLLEQALKRSGRLLMTP